MPGPDVLGAASLGSLAASSAPGVEGGRALPSPVPTLSFTSVRSGTHTLPSLPFCSLCFRCGSSKVHMQYVWAQGCPWPRLCLVQSFFLCETLLHLLPSCWRRSHAFKACPSLALLLLWQVLILVCLCHEIAQTAENIRRSDVGRYRLRSGVGHGKARQGGHPACKPKPSAKVGTVATR